MVFEVLNLKPPLLDQLCWLLLSSDEILPASWSFFDAILVSSVAIDMFSFCLCVSIEAGKLYSTKYVLDKNNEKRQLYL